MTTLKTLRREIFQILDPKGEEHLRAADIDTAINDTIRELCFDMNLLNDSAVTTTLSDQERYDLASALIWIPETATLSTARNDGTFSSSDTTLTVDDGSVFSVDQLIKIDSEYLYITAINNNDLTVVRGAAGSTAAAHAGGTNIYVGAALNLLRIRRVDYDGYRIKKTGIQTISELDMT